ncbi:MAG: DNA-binding protein [Polaromonas sp.]|uniref:DNA-binding protein n=1 Tax=Polaromonas sp. TaxID=1869339 RepID=UPI002489F0BE|nr:DNA-binding protein [Polaromonas sp.]MDI1270485.1 DNA-binding protein [Polaromonas sp.]
MKKNHVESIPSTMTTLASCMVSTIREDNLVAWSGGISDEEMARPGALLMGALLHRANERGQTLTAMAHELGRTYGYINQLRSGLRLISSISDDFALECAMYLSVPRQTIYMMAGKITPSDMFERNEMKACQIRHAMSFIVQDLEWGPLVTLELRQCAMDSQYCLVRLYEKATKKVLMDEHLDTDSLSLEISRLTELQDKRAQLMKNAAAKNKGWDD